MRKHVIGSLALVIAVAVLSTGVQAQPSPPGVGDPMPEIVLPGPADKEQKDYLGLSGNGVFKVEELRARVVIIEIFSMYCPYCQREAPNLNRLHERVQADPALAGRVKFIGIGAGNTPFEVGVFKKKYQIPFPLFDDEDYAIHQIIGKVRTPYFIVAGPRESGNRRVIYSRAGGLEDMDGFLDLLKRAMEGD